MSLYTDEKLQALCSKIVDEARKRDDTLEVQVCLKGYDLKKDKKFDANVVLPFCKRKNEKIVVLGDRELGEKAEAAGLPFISFDTVSGKTKEKKTLKKKIAAKNHAVITTNVFHKHFEIFYFNRKRTPFYLIGPQADLKAFYEEVARTVKFKLRQTNVVSFPAGCFEMGPGCISQNVHAGLSFLVSILKKGVQNIDTVFLKSAQGKPAKLY